MRLEETHRAQPGARFTPAVLLVSGVLVALASCQIGDPVDVEELKAQLPTAPSFGVGTVEEVEGGWLASFNDEHLTALAIEALEHNPDLQVAAASVAMAAGYARRAGALIGPSIDLGAGAYAANEAAGNGRAGAAARLQWELDLWGRLDSLQAAAQYRYMAAELTYAYARQSLAAQVAKSWFFCIETREQVLLAEEGIALYQQTLEITTAMFDQGAITRQDVHLARADLAAAREAERSASLADTQARRALEVLLGRYPASELAVTGGFDELPSGVPVGLPSELLERRPDIVAAERRVAAAFEVTGAAQAARLPRIGITAGGGVVSDDFQSFGTPGNGFWTIGANLLAPLYDGGYLEAGEDIATAEQEAAVAQYRAAGLQAFADVENALTGESLLREREAFLVESLSENTQAWELAQARYAAGESDLLAVLYLQRRVLNASVAILDIRTQIRTQRVALHLSLGGNFEVASDEASEDTGEDTSPTE